MKSIDWKLLALPIGALVFAMIIAYFTVAISSKYNDGQFSLFSKVERDLNDAKRRYNEAQRDKALYRQYLDTYLEYSEKGIIGQEQRLSWIEELQEINKKLKIPSLRYEISPQQKTTIRNINTPEGISINFSKMQLNMNLLHEADIITVFNTLKNKANGFYSLSECEITARSGIKQISRYQPNLSFVAADCYLDWYTVSADS